MAQTVGQQWTEEGEEEEVGAGEGQGGDRVAELPGSSAGQRAAAQRQRCFLRRDPCLLCPYMD